VTVLRAIESFVCPDGSVGIGDLVDSSDPLVKGREQWFEEVKVPEKQDVILEAVEAPPEETDPEGAVEAAKADVPSEAREKPAQGGLTTDDTKPVRTRGRRK
jgi:hypothetical protein